MLYLKLAARNIWRNKRRSLITMFSIMFAVFFAVVMKAQQKGTYDNMIHQLVGDFFGYIQIQQKDYWDDQILDNSFSISDLDQDLLKEGLGEYCPRLQSFAMAVGSSDASGGALVMGIDPLKETKLSNPQRKLIEGEMIGQNDKEILIGDKMAKKLNLSLGDSLVLLGMGYHGVSAAGKFPIKGIFHFGPPDLDKSMVIMPLKVSQELFAAEGRVTSLALDIPRADMDKVNTQLSQKLEGSELSCITWEEMMPELVQQIQADEAGGVIFIVILYMIIGFGIFGTLLMMTMERMYEFGVLISIGMSRLSLVLTFWIEGILLGAFGILMGWALAFPLIYYFYQYPIKLTGDAAQAMEEYGFEAVVKSSIDPGILLTQGFNILLIIMVLCLYPAMKIWMLKPVESMRD